jgi:hypothetical protein
VERIQLAGMGGRRLILAAVLLLSAAGFTGCAARQVSRSDARQILANFPGLKLPQEAIYVENVTQLDGTHAIAESSIKTAFKLEKVGGEWVVSEIRLDRGRWVRINELFPQLLENGIQRTHQDMNLVALGLERYRIYNARYPEAENVTQLMEMLYPRYASRMVVEDAWARPLQYRLDSPTRYTLISLGPDGRLSTDDDIVVSAGKD